MKNKSISVFLIILFICLVILPVQNVSACYQEKTIREIHIIERSFEKSYDFVLNGFIEVNNMNGDIEIKSWDREEINIFATSRMRTDDVELEVYKQGDRLSLEVIYPDRRWYRRSSALNINLVLTVPEISNLEIESMNGRIMIEGITGDVKAESMNEDVRIKNVHGEIRAESMNSLVTLLNVTGKVECESMNRGIEIENSTCSHIDAESMNGKIFVETSIDRTGYYRFESTNGDIILYIPADSEASIRAQSPRNRFRSDFDIGYNTRERRYDDWDYGQRKFYFDINGGGTRVILSTINGEIEIRRK